MKLIKPIGSKLIVKPLPMEDTQTESGITVLDLELEKAEVVEVSEEYSNRFKPKDIVLYPKGSGISLPHYKKTNCLWLDGRPVNEGGDIWALVVE